MLRLRITGTWQRENHRALADRKGNGCASAGRSRTIVASVYSLHQRPRGRALVDQSLSFENPLKVDDGLIGRRGRVSNRRCVCGARACGAGVIPIVAASVGRRALEA